MSNVVCDTFFVNFANEGRLKIMMLLKNGPLDVNSITKQLKSEQSAISHNLRKLEACNILECKKKGKQRIYSLNKSTVLPVLDIYQKHIIAHKCGLRCKQ